MIDYRLMKKRHRKFHIDEVEAMEERYIFLKKKLESPKSSTPENECIVGGKKDYSKLITEMSFLGKWLQTARNFMDKRDTVEKWENIAKLFPFEIKVRALQLNYKKWRMPIRRWLLNGRVYIYREEFNNWFNRNEEKLGQVIQTS